MLFCHIQIGSFVHKRIGQIDLYFPRYLIGSVLTARSPILDILGHMSDPFMYERSNQNATKQHFNIFT